MVDRASWAAWVRAGQQEQTAPAAAAAAGAGASSGSTLRAAFVTGATGFLGPFLVAQLLECLPEHRLYCLVRGDDGPAAQERLRRALVACCLLPPEDDGPVDPPASPIAAAFAHRVRVVVGDLTADRDLLDSLEEAEAAEVRQQVDVVVHNAAQVNHVLPYSALKRANVDGTIRVVKLALQCSRRPRLHFVSSVGALPIGKASAESLGPLTPVQLDEHNGYGQTKAVAERVVCEACRRFGLPVSVYRPSVVCGASDTGHSNWQDFENHLIRAMLLVGGVPRKSSYSFGWVPVDFVASAIAHLVAEGVATTSSPAGEECTPQCFHLNGIGPSLQVVVRALEDAGYPTLRDVPSAQEWADAIRALPPDELLEPYRDLLASLKWPASGLVSVSHTNDHASQALAGLAGGGVEVAGAADWPHVRPSTVHRVLDFLCAAGFLPPRPQCPAE